MDRDLKEQIDNIKSSKVSEEEKKRLIGIARQWGRKDRKLKRLSKEGRLKMIQADSIGMAVDFAKTLGKLIGQGELKETTGIMTKELKKHLKFELTIRLKKFGVLPL